MSYVLQDFMGEVSEERLTTLATNVSTSMDGNKNFIDQKDLAVAVMDALKAYTNAAAKAKRGSDAERILARQAKGILQAALKALAKSINNATEDRVLLLTTGFNLNKETRSLLVLAAIAGVYAVAGRTAGTIELSFDRPEGMQAGGFEYCVDPSTNEWIIVMCANRCSTTLTDMPPGVAVHIRAFALGARNQRVVSQTIIASAAFVGAPKRA